MRGRDDPDVGAEDFGAPDALELPLLQDAQQLRLRGEREFGDFVEKDRTAGRPFEPAGLLTVGAGKGAALVAEKLAFDQALGKGAAVDADERTRRSPRMTMEGRGDELLTGAALADDHDGLFGGRRAADRLEDGAHRRALTDQFGFGVDVFRCFRGVGCIGSAGTQRLNLGGQGPLLEGALQGEENFLQVERLTEIVIGWPRLHPLRSPPTSRRAR